MVPASRIRMLSAREVNTKGAFVLYWMTAFRRVGWNFSLQRASEWARRLQKPLLVLDTLGCDSPWASARFHRFLLDGMGDVLLSLHPSRAVYYPYVEAVREEGNVMGLVAALSSKACLLVTDDFPCHAHSRMVASADRQLSIQMELVDSNGILPLGPSGRVFERAYSFRRYLQKELSSRFPEFPESAPLGSFPRSSLQALVTKTTLERWPVARLEKATRALPGLPIDQSVCPAPQRGGTRAAKRRLKRFLDGGLSSYVESARHPDLDATSALSPYLHFGHLSTHQIVREIFRREEWAPIRIVGDPRGKRAGWWGLSASSEAFLDQLLTWRELGFHACRHGSDYDRYSSLPEWAARTLEEHAGDPRPHSYTLKQLEQAETGDRLWNAAQNQLLREGRIHNYLRMLWGKKILEWSPTPRTAFRRMIRLNDKYALDGRDPNSYSGISWILGRYDRAWGPERPIFGKVRYMSSENTLRKLKLREYLSKFAS